MTAVAVPVAMSVPVPPDGGHEAEGGQHQAAGDQREVHGGVAEVEHAGTFIPWSV